MANTIYLLLWANKWQEDVMCLLDRCRNFLGCVDVQMPEWCISYGRHSNTEENKLCLHTTASKTAPPRNEERNKNETPQNIVKGR
jgi:hypothetical protein